MLRPGPPRARPPAGAGSSPGPARASPRRYRAGMLALVAAPPTAEIREVPDPDPQRDEALVEVKAFSLNRGEVARLASMADGELTGWDVAGVVRQPAADGSGPAEGARVVGM